MGTPMLRALLTPGDTSFTCHLIIGFLKMLSKIKRKLRNISFATIFLSWRRWTYFGRVLASDCQVGTTLILHVGDVLACESACIDVRKDSKGVTVCLRARVAISDHHLQPSWMQTWWIYCKDPPKQASGQGNMFVLDMKIPWSFEWIYILDI